jgi:hypothetical protein
MIQAQYLVMLQRDLAQSTGFQKIDGDYGNDA